MNRNEILTVKIANCLQETGVSHTKLMLLADQDQLKSYSFLLQAESTRVLLHFMSVIVLVLNSIIFIYCGCSQRNVISYL